MLSQPRALLLTGTGRYSDPWHPFPETSRRIAAVLVASRYQVEAPDDVDVALASGSLPDLLVVNVGLPRDGERSPSDAAAAGLDAYLLSGRPLLAFHASATSFLDSPLWESALGGRWVRGTSMHPDQGNARVHLRPHIVTEGLEDFALIDERYSFLRVSPKLAVIATHNHAGMEHPLVWLREGDGELGRAAYDALGHDTHSFDSATHLALLHRIIAWLTSNT